MNNKKILMVLAIGASLLTISKISRKNKKIISEGEKAIIEKYSSYLEEKDFVVIPKKKYNNKLKFNVLMLPQYISVVKTILKVIR